MENVSRGHALVIEDDELDPEIQNPDTAIVLSNPQLPTAPTLTTTTRTGETLGFPINDEEGIIEGEVTEMGESEPGEQISAPVRSVLKTFKTAIAAAIGRHETKITVGKKTRTLHSRDVLEIENMAFAESQLSEAPHQYEGNWFKKVANRVWRGSIMKDFHRAKEFKHGLKLSAAAGIEGAITTEFNQEIDRRARDRIAEERNNMGRLQRAGYDIKNAFQEVFAIERDLHHKKLEVTQQLRAEYENDPSNNNNPLYHLVNRDIVTREAVARNLHDMPLEMLQQAHKGDNKVESVKLEGEAGKKVDTFLKEQILAKVIDEALAAKAAGQTPTKISEKLHGQLDSDLQNYFFSEEFQEWRKTLSPDQQKAFENSLTYASDILMQAEESLLPAVLENVDHYQSGNRLDFEIELTLGTAQYSANTEVKSERLFARKERASMNEKLWNRMRRNVSTNTGETYPYRQDAIRSGVRREMLLANAARIGRNETLGAVAGFFLGKGAANLARHGMSWMPFVGTGVVSGTMAGWKEWTAMNGLRAQYGYEEAMGLEHPRTQNAKRSAEFRAVDFHRMEMGRRAQQLADITEKLDSGDFDTSHVLQAISYLADSNARINLSDKYGINLMSASKDTPEGRAIYAREVRLHNLARATAMNKLNEVATDSTMRNDLGELFGILPGETHNIEDLVDKLTDHLETNLETGTRVSPELMSALGGLSENDRIQLLNEEQSLAGRDKAFKKLRWKSVVKRGVTTGIIAGGMSAALGQFFHHHETVTTSHTETFNSTIVDHALPSHPDGLHDGIAQITNPETGDVVNMHAHIPSGTHLVPVQVRVGGPDELATHYNLVTDNTHEVLARNMEFTNDGQLHMTTEVRDALLHNHITYKAEELTPVSWGGHETITQGEIDYTNWTNTLHYKDFPDQDIDAFFAKNIHESFAAHPDLTNGTRVETVTDINGLRNLFRGMENWVYKQENVQVDQIEGYNRVLHTGESMWSKLTGKAEFLVKGQSDTAKILHVPDLLAKVDGNRKVVDLIHEAINENPTGDPHHIFSNEARRIAWEMSYWGDEAHIPDANEVHTLLEYFNEIPSTTTVTDTESFIPHDSWFTATESLTRPVHAAADSIYTMSAPDWQTALFAAGYNHPLEQPKYKHDNTIDRSMYYYGYPGGEMSIRKEEYNKRKSPRLASNPNSILQQTQELDWYIQTLTDDENHTIKELEKQADNIIDTNTEAVVCIPAYKEASNLETCLQNYVDQTDNSGNSMASKITVVIYNNYSTNSAPDNSKDVVNRFKAAHPEQNIIFLDHRYNSKMPMGKIRRDLNNYVLSQIQKSPTSNEIILISNDADSTKISPQYISKAIQRFAESPSLDAIGGKIDFPEEIFRKVPTLYAEQRAWQFLDSIIKHKLNSAIPELAGANTMIRAKSYAAVGGYNPQSPLGEDLELGWMIKNARGTERKNAIIYDNSMSIQTNPRRAVIEWLKNDRGVSDRYANFSQNQEVYENRWMDLLDNNGIPYDTQRLERALTEIYTQLYNWAKNENPGQFDSYFRRAMQFLGVEYQVIDNNVKITNDERLKEYLRAKTNPNLIS